MSFQLFIMYVPFKVLPILVGMYVFFFFPSVPSLAFSCGGPDNLMTTRNKVVVGSSRAA